MQREPCPLSSPREAFLVLSSHLPLAMKAPPSSPFLLLLLLFFPSSGLAAPKDFNYEVQVLMTIKSLLKDPHGALKNWDPYSVDPCSWSFISCSPENLVTALEAPSKYLSGPLSPSIGNLTKLEILLLQNNNIIGPIPTEIGKLAKLRTLVLSSNKLDGTIPNSLGHLERLHYIDLSYNNLSGPMPKTSARTFNIVGNPLICAAEQDCDRTKLKPMFYPYITVEQ
ncbi:protein NSP-INTERACTING KINASE 1 isoform X2 [Sorghum bicolor]|uniref:protein NSP-INTERACTING KINASE 1 isoform X2 n=1 Tax=Sorghum bicolor TaxID=4558 RepID=UPI000B423E21|nr:protein NSP-INTERACTING KINASE 1 isoform X2 [Sorghum bicolor]|eukprot:XP_021305802.1 protein NSP-INTERACTING KINASE 1 isoform X2 [Sorghum bicolor]